MLLLASTVEETRGDHAAARSALRECLAISRGLNDVLMTARCLGDLGWHLLYEGDLNGAVQHVDEALCLVRAEPQPGCTPAILQLAGALALERHDWTAAQRYFAESLRSASDQGYGADRALEGLAIAAVRTSRFDHGLQLLAAAETIGASSRPRPWWHERVRAAWTTAMKALPAARADAALASGRAMREQATVAGGLAHQQALSATVDEDAPLSQRESDVVALVIEGLTNQQIAARMHLSVRTVETHMRNIRTTLGLRSRSHVAAWGARRGPAAASRKQSDHRMSPAQGVRLDPMKGSTPLRDLHTSPE
jgi:DNA-binding CsgD family transcriptional regulator